MIRISDVESNEIQQEMAAVNSIFKYSALVALALVKETLRFTPSSTKKPFKCSRLF